MSDTTAGFLQAGLLVVLLAAVHVPLGDYMARVYSSAKHARVERGLYRVMGVDPDADQRWTAYLRSVLAFSLVGLLFLYAFQRVQQHLLLSLGLPRRQGGPGVEHGRVVPDQHELAVVLRREHDGLTWCRWPAWPCRTSSPRPSASPIAIALVRGFARSRTERLGNFWVDLTRGCLRILLPLSFVFAIVLDRRRRHPELPRLRHHHHAGERPPDPHRRPGRVAGGHQGARHQRRRLLQRELRRTRSRTRPSGRTCSRSSCC